MLSIAPDEFFPVKSLTYCPHDQPSSRDLLILIKVEGVFTDVDIECKTVFMFF